MYDEIGMFLKKNFGRIISVDAEKRLYTVKDEKDASWTYSYPCHRVLAPDKKINYDFFIGKWDVRISGAYHTRVAEDKKITTVSGGMKLPPLEIKSDGTYSWSTSNNRVIKGVWKPRDGLPGITIIKGLDGLDWTVYESTEGFATSKDTKDEIRFHNIPTSTGYYVANRIGANKSCVLVGRKFN
jgi:hypothetical protein